MVLAELSANVAERFKYVGDGWVFGLESKIRSGQSNFSQAGTYRRLTGDKGRTSGGTALLSVPIRKQAAFFRNSIYVGRAISHDAMVVCADIEPADIITPDDQDVWFLVCHVFLLCCSYSDCSLLISVLENHYQPRARNDGPFDCRTNTTNNLQIAGQLKPGRNMEVVKRFYLVLRL